MRADTVRDETASEVNPIICPEKMKGVNCEAKMSEEVASTRVFDELASISSKVCDGLIPGGSIISE